MLVGAEEREQLGRLEVEDLEAEEPEELELGLLVRQIRVEEEEERVIMLELEV